MLHQEPVRTSTDTARASADTARNPQLPIALVILRDSGKSNGGAPMSNTLYMVVERFKNQDAVAVYRRFRDSGRMTPEGLLYVSSWVDEKLERCYQLMETHDPRLLDAWMAKWDDLVDFEVFPVITSREAAARTAPLL
jgi:Protein of unknown function (DUF3303)